MMKTIIAAGGLVQNKEKKFLLIFRKGKWDLPKGKVEKGEMLETAAVREVTEECGVPDLIIIKPITITGHNYNLEGEKIIKKTHWFLMKTSFTGKPVPQSEEDITKVIWANKKKMKELLSESYENIKAVVRDFC